jgi:hypothetical protein
VGERTESGLAAVGEHLPDGGVDALDGGAAVVPAGILVGEEDGHGGVGLEEEQVAGGAEAEVDAAVVEGEGVLDVVEGGESPGSEGAGHVFEEGGVFGAVGGVVGHVGAEVVDLPVRGDGGVEGVEAAVEHHDAVLAAEAVGAAGVEELEGEEVVAGERGEDEG